MLSHPSTISGTNASDFAVSSESCSDGACKILVTFTPGDLGGRTAKLSTDYGDVSLSGTGIKGPALTISPFVTLTAPVFGTVSGDVTITNNGTEALQRLYTTTTTGSGDVAFRDSIQCPSTLQPGQSCKDTIQFLPSKLGNVTGSLTVWTTQPGIWKEIVLTGFGLPVPLRLIRLR